jgi:hypothetical protein
MKVTVNAGTIGRNIAADTLHYVEGSSPQSEPTSVEEESVPGTGSIQVFISHSSQDRALALRLSDLIVRALGVPAAAIRCTSVDGHRLPAGARVSEVLRRDIQGAKVFLALLTPASLRSSYVLFEMGARWGQGTPLIPVLSADLGDDALTAPLSELNVLRVDQRAQVEQLLADLGQVLGRQVAAAHTYVRAIDELLPPGSRP